MVKWYACLLAAVVLVFTGCVKHPGSAAAGPSATPRPEPAVPIAVPEQVRAPGHASAVFQDGLDGYSGCAADPDGTTLKIDPAEGLGTIRVRFDDILSGLRTDAPRVEGARLELFFLYEWWTGYRHDVRCADAVTGGPSGGMVPIFGDRLDGKTKTKSKQFLAWELPPELVQRWLDDPGSNKGVSLFIEASELLDPAKDGDKEFGFMGNGTDLARYRPRLTVDYTGILRPAQPAWRTDFAERQAGGTFRVRWEAPDDEEAVFDIESGQDAAWTRVAEGLAAGTREYDWTVTGTGQIAFRIQARYGASSSGWRESAVFEQTAATVPFRLAAFPTIVKPAWDRPRGPGGAAEACIELARNEEEGVQLVIDGNDRALQEVRVAATDLVSAAGGTIPSAEIRIRPVGYVRTEPSGIYLTERDGWFADVLLEKSAFDMDPETVQPVWISFRAAADRAAGVYRGSLEVTAAGIEARSLALQITVRDFTLPAAQSLPVLMWGGTNAKAYGFEPGSREAQALAREHEDLLLAHRMTPGWLLNRFSWAKANLPRSGDGTFDFTDYDSQVERLLKGGMQRFIIGNAPRLGKWGFPEQYSDEWKQAFTEYIKAMTAHLKAKGWLERAIFYSIDEAASKERPSCKMLHALVKGIEPGLAILQTLNEPGATRELAPFADIINVNVRQYYKARVPELQQEGKETWWYMCCWPNENPNLFIEYPGVDPRIIGWMTWKFKTTGMVYWQTMAWEKAFEKMSDKRYVDEIRSEWQTASFGAYNGDGALLYPGPGGKILCSVRIENLRDGLEDYEYIVLLHKAVDEGRLQGADLERARKLLAIDDRICDKQFGYDRTGTDMFAARREIAELLERK